MFMASWRMRWIAPSLKWMMNYKLWLSQPSITCSSRMSRVGSWTRRHHRAELTVWRRRCTLNRRYTGAGPDICDIRQFGLSWQQQQSHSKDRLLVRDHAKNITALFFNISKSRVKTSSQSTTMRPIDDLVVINNAHTWVPRFERSKYDPS